MRYDPKHYRDLSPRPPALGPYLTAYQVADLALREFYRVVRSAPPLGPIEDALRRLYRTDFGPMRLR